MEKIIAVYTRTNRRDESRSAKLLSDQIQVCSQRARELFGEDVNFKVYKDAMVSGTSQVKPALTELLSAVSSGNVQAVITSSIDRLSRKLDAMNIIKHLIMDGVEFISIREGFHSKDNDALLKIDLLTDLYQFESNEHGLRISQGKQLRKNLR